MSRLTEVLEKMKALCNEHDGEDTFNSPVTTKEISNWESENNTKLSDELKEFYLFCNGMDLTIYFSTFNICPFEKITFREVGLLGYDEIKGYMKIGSFVGDGSIICIDRNYNVCCIYEGDSAITDSSLTELIEDEFDILIEKIEE